MQSNKREFHRNTSEVLLVASVDSKALKGTRANDEHKVDPSMGMLGVMLKGMIKTTASAASGCAGSPLDQNLGVSMICFLGRLR